jgi:hypothetical protein
MPIKEAEVLQMPILMNFILGASSAATVTLAAAARFRPGIRRDVAGYIPGFVAYVTRPIGVAADRTLLSAVKVFVHLAKDAPSPLSQSLPSAADV